MTPLDLLLEWSSGNPHQLVLHFVVLGVKMVLPFCLCTDAPSASPAGVRALFNIQCAPFCSQGRFFF